MIGAIIGDIVGSRFEFDNYRAKDFELFTEECFPTDDSIMTVAIGKAILDCDGAYDDLSAKTVSCMQKLGRRYPHCGYGGSFYDWMYSDDPQPYHSFGNGAAMRISPVGEYARSEEEVRRLSKHKWLLLGANNVDSNITVASFETKGDAQKEMQSQIDALTEESNNAECSIEETAASVYIQSNYWYWNIVPIESES